MRSTIASLTSVAAALFISAYGATPELQQLSDRDTAAGLAFMLVPYLFLVAAVFMVRSTRARWTVLIAASVSLLVAVMMELPSAWKVGEDTYLQFAAMLSRYPIALIALAMAFVSLDFHRLRAESASNSTAGSDARKSGARGSL